MIIQGIIFTAPGFRILEYRLVHIYIARLFLNKAHQVS